MLVNRAERVRSVEHRTLYGLDSHLLFHRDFAFFRNGRRLSADSEVPNGPLRAEGTPFGEAHLVALGPEIAKTCLPCPSVTV